MAWYEILNGVRQTLRMAAVRSTETDPEAGEVEIVTPVIRLAGTEAANGLCTPSLMAVTDTGEIPAGARSISIANAGDVAATVAGGSLSPGVSVSWEAPVGASLAAIPYDATSTQLLIAEVR